MRSPRLWLFLVSALLGISVLEGLVLSRSNPRLVPRPRSLFSRPRLAASPNAFADSVRESLEAPPDEIISAVEKAPGYRLSVSDAAALGGVDLAQARRGLLTLSTLTGGDLQVTQDGDIVYTFSPDFKSTLSRRSPRIKLRQAVRAVTPPLFFLVRVTFGLALFASLAIVVSAVVVAGSSGGGSSSSSNNKDDNRRSRSPGFSLGYSNFGPSPLDFIVYRRDARSYYDEENNVPDYMSADEGQGRGRPLSFIESFFSFVFGDGDPNKTFATAQLQQVSALIRQKGGVVVAEQLAPYLDPPMLPASLLRGLEPAAAREIEETFGAYSSAGRVESAVVDESWMLPAVVQLGGEPLVSPAGNIYYRFPDLAITALTSSREAPTGIQLYEKAVPFSRAGPLQVFFAGLLGVANLVGVSYVGTLLRSPAFLAGAPVYAAVLQKLLPFLTAYAGVYLGTPLVRYVQLQGVNAGIRRRNLARALWAKALKEAVPTSAGPFGLNPSSLETKIDDVKAQLGAASVKKVIGDKDIFYSTSSK